MIKEQKESAFYFFLDNNTPHILKITHEGKIIFNRAAYPDMVADDFARNVLFILEKSIVPGLKPDDE